MPSIQSTSWWQRSYYTWIEIFDMMSTARFFRYPDFLDTQIVSGLVSRNLNPVLLSPSFCLILSRFIRFSNSVFDTSNVEKPFLAIGFA